jgi:short-subunit dehydrogenase
MTDELADRWALVTGSSSGIGLDLARELADRGAHLVLVARRRERLEEVADELSNTYGIETRVVDMDLARRGAARELYERVETFDDVEIDVLVNNAGFGIYDDFLGSDWEAQEDLIDLDVVTPVHLTKLYAEQMVERGGGYILQVASIGSFQPTPTYSTYGAAKSFLLHFSEALDFELADTPVSCTSLCPGPTATEFFDVSGQDLTLYQRLVMMESAEVAAIGVRAMLREQRTVVPGWMNWLTVFMGRFVPRTLFTWATHVTMKNEDE